MPPKVALVTGAGSGIGRAVTIALLHEGYAVALAGRRKQALEETVQLAGPTATRVLIAPPAVRDPAAVQRLFDLTQAAFGRLDLLFNNAGIFPPPQAIEEVTYQGWLEAVNINLTGAFLCAQQAFKLMKAQQPRGGRIINNGSLSAQVPRPNSIAYTTTKHAITGLTKSLSLDGRPFDIACGQIDIGNAETALMTRVKKGALQANGTVVPEPTMDVENAARGVLYMASLPLDANVQFLTITATKMPYIGRG